MPNTITAQLQIAAQNAIPAFRSSLLPIRAFSTSFIPSAAERGDRVRVPVIGAPSPASDFNGSYTADADSTIQGVDVILNRHKFKTVHLTAREASQIYGNALDDLVAGAVKQLAEDVVKDVFSVVTAANYGAPVIAAVTAANFDLSKLLAIREECSKAKMPTQGRSLIIDSAYYTNLIADEKVILSNVTTLAGGAAVEAAVPRLAGMDIYESTIIPENGEKLVGFAAHPSGLAVAMRYLEPVASYDTALQIVDDETGLVFGLLSYGDTTSNRIYVTVECLYGFAKAIGDGIKRIVKP